MSATLEQIESLLVDLNARMDAAPAPFTEEQARQVVNDMLTARLSDPNDEVYRKLRFGGGDPRLIGTKFSRWNLTTADIELLYDIQMSRAARGKSGPSDELTRAFNAVSDAVYMSAEDVRAIDRVAIDEQFPRVTRANRAEYQRAMDSAESGYGSQLIGAQYVGDLWEAARPMQRVFDKFPSFEMTAPTTYLPVEAGIPVMSFVSESTDYNSSNYATTKTGSNRVSLTAKKFVIHQMWSGEMSEDSIIPFLPFLRRQLAVAIAYYSDALLMNGDTTNAGSGNINLDDADPGDTLYYLALDGLRHAGLVDNTANSVSLAAAITLNDFFKARKRMSQATYAPMHWGMPVNRDDLIHFCDPDTYFSILNLDEFVTVDKYGPQATVLTGEVGRVGGHALIPTQVIKLAETDGKIDNADDGTTGSVVTVNTRGSVIGWRRRIQIETERLPATDQDRLVASMRLGFAQFSPTGARSAIEHCDVIYNISL